MKKDSKLPNRIINFRSFVITAFFAIITVLTCYFWLLGFDYLAYVALILIGNFLIYQFVKHFRLYKFGYQSITFIIAIIVCSIIVLTIQSTSKNWNELENSELVKSDKEITVIGIVGENSKIDYQTNTAIFFIRDVVADNIKLKGKVRVTIITDNPINLENIKCGYSMSFVSIVKTYKLISDDNEVNTNSYRTNIRYSTEIDENKITFSVGKPNFGESIRIQAKTQIYAGMAEDYASIAFGMLIGDKFDMDTVVRYYFSASGIGHILAVSGLHVGFLIIILNVIFSKLLKLRKLPLIVINITFISLYAFIVQFSPSVIRAGVMSIVSLVTIISGDRRDSLNNLAFAATLLLTISPLYLFDVGFLMSFSSVLAILLFSTKISSFLSKFKMPKWLHNSLGVSCAAQIGILPVCMIFFHQISLLSTISNLICLPIVLIVFIMLFVFTIIVAVLPFMSQLYFLAFIGLFVVDLVARLVNEVPFSTLVIYPSILVIVFAYPLYLVKSSYFLFKPKRLIVYTLVIACAFTVLPRKSMYPLSNSLIIPLDTFSSVDSLYVSTTNRNYLVGEFASRTSILQSLYKWKIKNVDALFVANLNENNSKNIVELSYMFGIPVIYAGKTDNITGVYTLIDEGVNLILAGTEDIIEYNEFSFVNLISEDNSTSLGFIINCQTSLSSNVIIYQDTYLSKQNHISYETFDTFKIIRTFYCASFSDTQIKLSNYTKIDNLESNVDFINNYKIINMDYIGNYSFGIATGAITQIITLQL